MRGRVSFVNHRCCDSYTCTSNNQNERHWWRLYKCPNPFKNQSELTYEKDNPFYAP